MTKATRLKAIASSVSLLFITISTLALITGLLGLALSEDFTERSASAQVIKISSAFLLLSVACFVPLRKNVITELVDAFIVVSSFWLMVPLFSAAMYSLTIGLPPADALFESLSGFTGTGLTVLSRPEEVPKVVLAWRALTQWVGELGIVVFSGVLLPFLHRSIRSIYVVERGARIAPTILSTTRRLFAIYALYTLFGAVAFFLSGMDLFSSVTHSMTAIATGGMSTRSENIGYWLRNGGAIAVSSCVLMMLGSLNFVDLYNLTIGRLREFVRSVEVRGLAASLIAFAGLLWLVALALGSPDSYGVWVFHLISAHTTTGFSTASVYEFPELVKVILIASMIVGGATFSTAGGLKVKRVVVSAKAIAWEMGKVFVPRPAVVIKRVGAEVIKDEEVLSVYSYAALYLVVLLLLAAGVHLSLLASGAVNYSFIDSLFEVASALSCVGLSTGITSTSAPLATKVLLMVAMYLGRIEFLPLYIAVGAYYIEKTTV